MESQVPSVVVVDSAFKCILVILCSTIRKHWDAIVAYLFSSECKKEFKKTEESDSVLVKCLFLTVSLPVGLLKLSDNTLC